MSLQTDVPGTHMRAVQYYSHRTVRILLTVAQIALAVTAFGNVSSAAVINGGFEDGTFTNWRSIGNTNVVGSYNPFASVGTASPLEGSYQAHIKTDGVSLSDLAGFLGVTEDMIRNANGGIDATNGSAIKTGVYATAGETISFGWRFLDEERCSMPKSR